MVTRALVCASASSLDPCRSMFLPVAASSKRRYRAWPSVASDRLGVRRRGVLSAAHPCASALVGSPSTSRTPPHFGARSDIGHPDHRRPCSNSETSWHRAARPRRQVPIRIRALVGASTSPLDPVDRCSCPLLRGADSRAWPSVHPTRSGRGGGMACFPAAPPCSCALGGSPSSSTPTTTGACPPPNHAVAPPRAELDAAHVMGGHLYSAGRTTIAAIAWTESGFSAVGTPPRGRVICSSPLVLGFGLEMSP